ncbi:MAG: hypothetical protein ACTHK7_13455 [Aureliella sp.]
MNARGVVVVLALCVFTLSTPSLSADDSWWSGMTGSKSTSSSASKSSSSWWPWSSSASSAKSSSAKKKSHSKPSTFNKMAKSTKSAWNKTVDFLNPFDSKPAEKSGPRGSVPNTGSWFPSSSSSASISDKPSSVPEWMAGERPTF